MTRNVWEWMEVREMSQTMREDWAKFGHTLMFDTQCVRIDVCLHDNCHANNKLFYIPWQWIQKLEFKVYNIHSYSVLYITCVLYFICIYRFSHYLCMIMWALHHIFNCIPYYIYNSLLLKSSLKTDMTMLKNFAWVVNGVQKCVSYKCLIIC